MTPFEKLSERDIQLIEDYITAFASRDVGNLYDSNRRDLKVVLDYWNQSKEDLFNLLGQELIQKRLFVYKQNTDGLIMSFEQHHEDKPYKDFLNWWTWDIKHKASIKFEIEMASMNTYLSKYFYIEDAFTDKTLAENSYSGADYKVIFEDGTVFKVSTGMKPMKILHKFVEKFGTPKDEKMFEEFRIWHSQLLNQKTVDGELCLSIHPLDYFTMSNNDNGWTSCMRWADKYGNIEHGDYCAGTVECMNSPYIVVAYLNNPKHTYSLPSIGSNWEWNSKQWRELFIVRDGIINEIKAYPYQDENLTNGCITWLKELAGKNLGWTYDDEEVDVGQPIEKDDCVFYFEYLKSPYMYKDIGTLKKHIGRVNYDSLRDERKFHNSSITWRRNLDENKKHNFIDIPYGGVATCLFCGCEYEDEGYENALLCPNCEVIECCPICGEPLSGETFWIDELNSNICYDCYEDKTSTDSFSDEIHLYDNMDNIYLLLGYDSNEQPVYYDEVALCYQPEYNWSYQNVFKQAPISGNDYRNYVTLDMLNPEAAKDFCNAFNVWPRKFVFENQNMFIQSFLGNYIDEYDLYYDWNKQPLFPEDEE